MKFIRWLLGTETIKTESRRAFFGKAVAAPAALGSMAAFEATARRLNLDEGLQEREAARAARLDENLKAHPNTCSAKVLVTSSCSTTLAYPYPRTVSYAAHSLPVRISVGTW